MEAKLTKKQKRVLAELFGDKLEESEVLEKHAVRAETFDKWLADDVFLAEYMRLSLRRNKIVVAKYASVATSKLIALTSSETGETARKACLDIVTLQQDMEPPAPQTAEKENRFEPEIDPETASKMLALLAESRDKKKNQPFL